MAGSADGSAGGGEIPGFGSATPPPNPASESYDDRPRPAAPDGPADKPPPANQGDDPAPAA